MYLLEEVQGKETPFFLRYFQDTGGPPSSTAFTDLVQTGLPPVKHSTVLQSPLLVPDEVARNEDAKSPSLLEDGTGEEEMHSRPLSLAEITPISSREELLSISARQSLPTTPSGSGSLRGDSVLLESVTKASRRMHSHEVSVVENCDVTFNPDDSSGSVQIWRVDPGGLVSLPDHEYGIFFEMEMYMVLYIYEVRFCVHACVPWVPVALCSPLSSEGIGGSVRGGGDGLTFLQYVFFMQSGDAISTLPTSVFSSSDSGREPFVRKKTALYLWQGRQCPKGRFLAWKMGQERQVLAQVQQRMGGATSQVVWKPVFVMDVSHSSLTHTHTHTLTHTPSLPD